MARISTYAVDGQPVSSDKLIGTDSSGTTTKNYPLGSVSDWLKESGASAVLGQNNYSFQIALDPDAGRLPGSFSFENYGGDGTEFLDISRLMVSKSSSTGKYVGDYLLSIVGDRVMLGQLDDLNSFGVYTLVSLVQSPIEPTFYDAELLFVEGNGALLGNKLYGLATYSASASAESAVWGSIEGTVTNQTDLVDYIDAEIAAIPVPATPTLQTVTDEGNTTTNSITAGTITANNELHLVNNAMRIFRSGDDMRLRTNNSDRMTITANGNIGIGKTYASYKLDITGTMRIEGGDFSVDGNRSIYFGPSGAQGRLRMSGNFASYSDTGHFWYTDSEVSTPSMLLLENGNVGIGTTAPTEKLEVDGNIKIHRHGANDIAELKLEADRSFGRTITLGTTGAAPYIKSDHNLSITAYSGTAPDTQIYLSGGGADDHIRFNTNQTERARITNTGLGIGTTAPTDKLEVVSSDNIGTTKIVSAVSLSGSQRTSLGYNSVMGSHSLSLVSQASDLTLYTKTARPIVFNTNNTEAARITDTGNVGIGTTAPSALLEIASNSTNDFIKLTTTGGGATPVKLIFEKTAVEQGIIEYNRNGNLEIYNTDNDGGVLISGSGSANADMYINHAGNVGIGTTAPLAKFHVKDGNTLTAALPNTGALIEGFSQSILQVASHSTGYSQLAFGDQDDGFDGGLIYSNASRYLAIEAANVERMRFTSNGRVGIGTTAPSEILQVGNDSVGGNYIQIAKKDNSSAGIKISQTGGGRVGFLRVNQSEDLEIGTELNNDVDIFTNGVSRVTIDGDNGSTQGYVGIRTTTPESELTVNGYIQVPNGRGITFSDIGDGNANRVSIVGSEDSDTMFFKTDNSVRMAFASGNVGIGTTSPDVKLQVVGQAQELGNSFNGLLYLKGTNALASYDTANKIVISSNGSSDGLYPGGLHFTRRNFAQQGNYGSGIRGISVGTVLQDNALELYTSTNTERNATRLKITSTGNVGIGTTAPAYKLQVGGTINADKIFIDNTTDGHQIGKLIIDYQAAQNPALNSAGGDYIRFNNSILLGGNGDNIKASSTKSDDLYFQHQRTGNVGFRFTTADSGSVLRIAGSGNVGIGTTAPDSKVHISGTAMQQLRMETAGGPSSAGDTNGRIGDMAYDDDFFYIKTANGWGRVQLDFGF